MDTNLVLDRDLAAGVASAEGVGDRMNFGIGEEMAVARVRGLRATLGRLDVMLMALESVPELAADNGVMAQLANVDDGLCEKVRLFGVIANFASERIGRDAS